MGVSVWWIWAVCSHGRSRIAMMSTDMPVQRALWWAHQIAQNAEVVQVMLERRGWRLPV